MRVGIIGHGTLGGAIAEGLRSSGAVTSIESTTRCTSGKNPSLARASDVVLLCVKPRDVEPALHSIVDELTDHHVLISTAASVGIEELRLWSRKRARVVRAMPNTPASAGEAMTVVARDEQSCDRAIETARRLFSSLGRTIVMNEAQMDAVTAVSGCGPAYVFVVIEAMIDAAIALGVGYDDAREMVAQTVLGSAKLLLAGDAHPAVLKTAVATPGGRTIRGLIELEEGNLRATLSRAVRAAAASQGPLQTARSSLRP
jgi:pyrroline-5-carboxylate reductase